MTGEEKAYLSNLLDAGCTQRMAEQCLFLLKEGKKSEALRLLAAHRSDLLKRLHASQKQLDCLDYFIYKNR